MKAYVVFYSDQCCTLVHADTPGKAKIAAMASVFGDPDYLVYRAKRVSGLDDKPITYSNAKDAGFEYTEEDSSDLMPEEEFYNDCHCEICRPKRGA